MCELTGEKMNAATSEPREWWMVVGVKDKDKEIFPTRALADALALVNNFKYAGLGPYRVLHVMEDDADAPYPGVTMQAAEDRVEDRTEAGEYAAAEACERETLTERRAEEAERAHKAVMEGTP